MELAGGGAVCYAPSRLGKLVLRITGFPRVTHQCHQSQQREDSHHRETRHLYLGFHHPWDRDLWKSWIKQVSQTQGILHYYWANFVSTVLVDFPFFCFFFLFFYFFISAKILSSCGQEEKNCIHGTGREDKNESISFEILVGSVEMNPSRRIMKFVLRFNPFRSIDIRSGRYFLEKFTPPKTFRFLPIRIAREYPWNGDFNLETTSSIHWNFEFQRHGGSVFPTRRTTTQPR